QFELSFLISRKAQETGVFGYQKFTYDGELFEHLRMASRVLFEALLNKRSNHLQRRSVSMKRTLAFVAAWLVVALLGVTAGAAAQGVQTGTIRGTVVDQQDLPVGNVTVTLTSKALQGTRTATPASDGSYPF